MSRARTELLSDRRSWRPKVDDPPPEKIEELASYGLTRKLMALRLGMHISTLNTKMQKSAKLKQAELRGKQKYNE